MFRLTFNHVFLFLMAIAGLTAFVVPSRMLVTRVPAVDVVFAPVSWPSRIIANSVHGSFAPPELSSDKREADVVKRENEELKSEIASLYVRLNELQKLEEEHAKLDIRDMCTPFTVAGSDVGARVSLGIIGSSWHGLKDGMVALYPQGIVGRVQRAGLAGARVQLITDYGFRVKCGFVRFDGTKYIRLNPLQSEAEGTGHGAMHISLITREDVKTAGLAAEDLVVVNDPDWAKYLQGRVLGRITAIRPRPDAPLFAQITVQPQQNLLRLKEVMIVTKDKSPKPEE